MDFKLYVMISVVVLVMVSIAALIFWPIKIYILDPFFNPMVEINAMVKNSIAEKAGASTANAWDNLRREWHALCVTAVLVLFLLVILEIVKIFHPAQPTPSYYHWG